MVPPPYLPKRLFLSLTFILYNSIVSPYSRRSRLPNCQEGSLYISLPIVTITDIFHLFSFRWIGTKEAIWFSIANIERCKYKPLMALRLTCKELEAIASRQLFRTFCLSPSLWNLGQSSNTIANSRKFQRHLRALALERQNDSGKFIFVDSVNQRAYNKKPFQNISSIGWWS